MGDLIGLLWDDEEEPPSDVFHQKSCGLDRLEPARDRRWR